MKKFLRIGLLHLITTLCFGSVQAQVFQQSKTIKGNVELQTTNYGTYGFDAAVNKGGGFWPRGSDNQYIFGAGIWFAALKLKEGETIPRKLVSISFNPNTGKSSMVPGRTEDGVAVSTTNINKYRIQTSIDYNTNGTPKNPADPQWPVWNTRGALKENANFGAYVYNESNRTSVVYPQGAAFVSDEDVITVFKDTDINHYEDSVITRIQEKGYPLGIQYEQAIYSWEMGSPLQDIIVVRYTAINTSTDILRECYLAPMLDADIALRSNASNGAQNDRTTFFYDIPELETAIQWTEGNQQEAGKGFGYLGATLLETPAVDVNGNLRQDKPFYSRDEQIGMHTFRNWTIDIDPSTEEQRYNFIATGSKDGDNGPGDKRMLISTGPFVMNPGDTARIAIGLIFANPTGGVAANGTLKTLGELIGKVNLIRKELYPGIFTSIETENLSKDKSAFISLKNDIATLHFKNESFKNIRAELFNALGERVITIHNGDISTNEISFKTSELPAGMYYCVIASNGERITLPMTIVR